jgi:hypothetical protein
VSSNAIAPVAGGGVVYVATPGAFPDVSALPADGCGSATCTPIGGGYFTGDYSVHLAVAGGHVVAGGGQHLTALAAEG